MARLRLMVPVGAMELWWVKRAGFSQRLDQFRSMFGDPLHVAGILGVKHAAADAVAGLIAIGGHFRTLAKHFRGDFVVLRQDRRRALLLASSRATSQPTRAISAPLPR